MQSRPEPAVLSSSSTWDNLGDKNAWVFTDVGVIGATCNTETQTGVSLESETKNKR